jgi:hypothetical protein
VCRQQFLVIWLNDLKFEQLADASFYHQGERAAVSTDSSATKVHETQWFLNTCFPIWSHAQLNLIFNVSIRSLDEELQRHKMKNAQVCICVRWITFALLAYYKQLWFASFIDCAWLLVLFSAWSHLWLHFVRSKSVLRYLIPKTKKKKERKELVKIWFWFLNYVLNSNFVVYQ